MAGIEDRKAELIAQIGRARRRIDDSGASVRHALDVPARVRQAYKKHSVAWIGGAILAGILIARIPPRTRKVYVDAEGSRIKLPKNAGKAGLLLAGGKLAFDLLRPFLAKWLATQATPFAEQWLARFMPHSHDAEEPLSQKQR